MGVRSSTGKPRFIEKVLTAPGTKQVWYGGLAFFTSTFSMRCCHNSETSKGGVPHCYKPNARNWRSVLESVQSSLKALPEKFDKDSLMSLKDEIIKDPKGY